ncbi:restriction endonuclease subunit S [Glaesserella parasuis]|nr:restriction endonuclease subunit S [Glaesserella parasuis]
MSSWKEYKLGEIATFYNGRAYKNTEFKVSGTPIVRIQNLTGEGKIVYSDLNLDENKYIDYGDLIYAWSATFGPYIWKGEKSIYHYHIWKIICNEELLDKKYFYYKLKQISDNLKDSGGNGSIFVHITKAFMENFKVKIPSLNEQKRVSSILAYLDEKIQLNTQINQTLEQIAQTIFKSWFIDFDPVHAKANALASGQTAEQATQAAMAVISGKNTQELHRLQTANPEQYQQLWEIAETFPSGFDEEGVPRGWAVKRIEDVIRKIPTGKKYSQKTAFEVGNIPILDQGKSGVIGYHNDEAGVKASIENPVIVFANHTCYMRLISYDFSAIQNVFAFVGKESNVLWTYLATLGKQEFTEYKGHFPDFLIKEIIVPNNELTELFGVVVKEHFQQIACNDKQNKTLANVRDLLLPKLLSGEV